MHALHALQECDAGRSGHLSTSGPRFQNQRPAEHAPGRRRSPWDTIRPEAVMIRKLKTGEYRLYSRKKNPKTGKRRNLGTFTSRAAAEKHERAVQYFKHGG
jgi:hypothetical protein